MKKLGIIVDSFSGMSKDEVNKLGFEYIHQTVILDGTTFKEGIDGTLVDLIDKIVESKDQKTSMPAIGNVIDMFEKTTKEYENVIFIPMNSWMSSTYSTALMASKEFNNIHVVDNKFAGHTAISVGQRVVKMAEEGITIEEIIKYITYISQSTITYLLPNNLEQLIKGGRLTGVKKFIMEKGKLIPRLYVSHKGFTTKGLKRNFAKAIGSSIDKILNEIGEENKDEYVWELLHSTGDEQIEMGKKALTERNITKFDIFPASAATAAHTGKGSIGINIYKK